MDVVGPKTKVKSEKSSLHFFFQTSQSSWREMRWRGKKKSQEKNLKSVFDFPFLGHCVWMLCGIDWCPLRIFSMHYWPKKGHRHANCTLYNSSKTKFIFHKPNYYMLYYRNRKWHEKSFPLSTNSYIVVFCLRFQIVRGKHT